MTTALLFAASRLKIATPLNGVLSHTHIYVHTYYVSVRGGDFVVALRRSRCSVESIFVVEADVSTWCCGRVGVSVWLPDDALSVAYAVRNPAELVEMQRKLSASRRPRNRVPPLAHVLASTVEYNNEIGVVKSDIRMFLIA